MTNFTTVTGEGEVELTIGSYSSTKTFNNLAPLSYIIIDMDTWDASLGEYNMEACLISGDSDPSNDCTQQNISVVPPIANFIANETVVLTGLDLTFFDKSEYNVSSYSWTFEGGTPSSSTDSEPQITYNAPGVYDVELVITHANGSETILKENYIEVSDEILASYEIINNVEEFPIYGVFFVNENLGYARMGSDFAGKYGKTTDGGDNWEIITVPGINKTITSIMFTDEMNGFFRTSQYGSPVVVYQTNDGGESWNYYAEGLHSQLFRMDAFDQDHVIICGQQSIYDTDVSVTANGPNGWTNQLSPEADPWSQYQGVQYLSADSIFAMRFMDANFSYDGGATWHNKSIHEIYNGPWENFGLNDVSFPNRGNVGFAAGTHYNEGGGIILKSSDNGQSWDECGRGFNEGRNTHFYDKNIGFVTGYDGFIYKTSDGGETWYGSNLNEGNMSDPFVVNENLVFACVQGKCYRSKNGFFQQPINKDLKVHELNMPNSILLANAPFTINVAVMNVGKEFINQYSLSYQVDNGEVISQDFNPNYLTPNNVIVIDSFDTKWTPVAGEFDVKIWIESVDGQSDENQSNDTLVHHVLVTGDQWDNRKVLLEEATGTWCGYCVNGVLTIEALEEAYNTDKTRVIPVAIHGSDQWEVPNGRVLLNTYSGGSYPSGWVDRTMYFGESSVALETSKWGMYTEEQLGTNAPMNVKIAANIDLDSRMLEIETDASFYASIESNMRFNCMILEDNLKANQSNAYNNIQGHPYYGLGDPIPNFNHKHILREILEDPWGVQGELPTSVSSGESFQHTFQYSIPQDYNMENISVVCFVSKHQESINEREVLNANVAYYNEFITVNSNEINQNESSINIYPNPAHETLNIKWTDLDKNPCTIEILNNTGQLLHTQIVYPISDINRKSIPIHSFTKGVYFIKMNGKTFSSVKKFVVQ